MKKILFLSAFLLLVLGFGSCSNTDLDSSINETNQSVVNNANDVINNLESSFETHTRANGVQSVYPDY